jgi:hypothetical protein
MSLIRQQIKKLYLAKRGWHYNRESLKWQSEI